MERYVPRPVAEMADQCQLHRPKVASYGTVLRKFLSAFPHVTTDALLVARPMTACAAKRTSL
jgi:hypothetical protein